MLVIPVDHQWLPFSNDRPTVRSAVHRTKTDCGHKGHCVCVSGVFMGPIFHLTSLSYDMWLGMYARYISGARWNVKVGLQRQR